jgi:hypothetical protein
MSWQPAQVSVEAFGADAGAGVAGASVVIVSSAMVMRLEGRTMRLQGCSRSRWLQVLQGQQEPLQGLLQVQRSLQRLV